MSNLFSRFANDKSGATAIEYGLIASLISIAAIAAFTTVGSELLFAHVRLRGGGRPGRAGPGGSVSGQLTKQPGARASAGCGAVLGLPAGDEAGREPSNSPQWNAGMKRNGFIRSGFARR